MDFLSSLRLYQKIEWAKEKGLWLVVVILATAAAFFAALWFTLFILFFFQPQPYYASSVPEFQAKKQNGYKLFSVFQNLALKTQICNQQGFVYTGSSMGQDEFCSFNYQRIPKMNGPFDLNLQGLNSIEVRYASVCILKISKEVIPVQIQNDTQKQKWRRHSPNRYVCQKYRAYNEIHLANAINDNQLAFFQIQIQLTEKGYETFEATDIKIKFQEVASHTQRFIIDYYWIIGFIISLVVASWIAFIVFAIGIVLIVQKVLQQKQKQEERLLLNINISQKRD